MICSQTFGVTFRYQTPSGYTRAIGPSLQILKHPTLLRYAATSGPKSLIRFLR